MKALGLSEAEKVHQGPPAKAKQTIEENWKKIKLMEYVQPWPSPINTGT